MSVTSERIKSSRQQKKLTQQGLADIINSSRGSVAKIETDVFTPSFAMLSLIADALDTTVDYLQGKTDNSFKTDKDISDSEDDYVTQEKVAGLFRKFGEQEGLSEKEQQDLAENMNDYLEMRLKRLKQKKE